MPIRVVLKMPILEMPIPKQFLKVAEVAELLKVKPRTIYEMVAQNRIPIESRLGQTFSVSISKKSSSGPDEKTDDLKDRCCYHPPRSLVAATSRITTDVCL